MCLDILEKIEGRKKYARQAFRNDVKTTLGLTTFDNNLLQDPNIGCNKLADITSTARKKNLKKTSNSINIKMRSEKMEHNT